MEIRSVNHLLIFFCIFFTFLAGCGFQLNRNQIQLVKNASSISVFEISNKSFTPGLEVELLSSLINGLEQRSISILPPQKADLTLFFQVTSVAVWKSKYSLDTESNTQTYEFKFEVGGRLTVMDNRQAGKSSLESRFSSRSQSNNQTSNRTPQKKESTLLIDNAPITGSYSLKTTNQDLNQIENTEGNEKMVIALKDKIIEKLSVNF